MYNLHVNCDISICHWMFTYLLNKCKICLMYIYTCIKCIRIQPLILCVTLKFIIYASYMYIVYGFFLWLLYRFMYYVPHLNLLYKCTCILYSTSLYFVFNTFYNVKSAAQDKIHVVLKRNQLKCNQLKCNQSISSYLGLFWYKILYAITYAVIPVFRNWANLFPFKLHINWNHHMSLSLVSQIMQINWGISPICSYLKNIHVMSNAITEYGLHMYVGSLWNWSVLDFFPTEPEKPHTDTMVESHQCV